MNTISKLLMALVCLYSSTLLAQQNTHNHPIQQECAAEITPRQKARLDRTALARQRFQDNGRVGTLYIPVRHIITRKNDGSDGISSTDLQTAMDDLNTVYAAGNIQFYECSRVYVYNDTLNDLHTRNKSVLTSSYAVSNVVNIYHVNTYFNDTKSFCGSAPYPGGSDNIFMKNSCTMNGSTFPHEFGHYFSVYHTHNGGNELVDGSNCTTAGDLICDTEADPTLGNSNVNSSCVYTGTDTDANGDVYNPPTTNYMSYSRKSCRTEFTAGQWARIRYSAINDRAYLTCSCFTYDYVGSFNFGTTTSGNNYTTSANVYTTTVYNCDSDNDQLRVGDCSSAPNTGGDFVSVEFDVPAGTDKLRLLLKGGWQNGSSEIYIDNAYQTDFTLSTANCSSTYTYVYIYNISNLTQDGKVVIKLVDPDPGCSGDFNIDNMLVYAANCNQSGYAKLPYTTTFSSGVLDNYWLTQSSNEFGRARLTNLNGPYIGGYHLVMDSKTNGEYATNQADLRVDLANCSTVSLYFRWKEFNDETHTTDGVYLSDDGGENFVKIYDLTGGANNTWNSVFLDIDNLASINGLSLSEESIIRFQQYDDFSATTDGIAIDYVRVLGCNNTPAPMLVMADNDHTIGEVRSYYTGSEFSQNDPQLGSFNAVDQSVGLEVFPNPAKEELNLQLTAFEANEKLTIKLVNMLGQTQYSSQHTINSSSKDLVRLQVQQLPAGVYTVVIENQKRVIAHQQVVLQ